jgi:hypothetical protein
MLHTGEVRLGWVGKQVVVLAPHVGQVAGQQPLVDAQLRWKARHVGGLSASRPRKLADAVDRVVVVEGQQETYVVVDACSEDPAHLRLLGWHHSWNDDAERSPCAERGRVAGVPRPDGGVEHGASGTINLVDNAAT